MPELPEVETIVGDLAPHLIGRRIAEVLVLDPKVVPQAEEFVRRVVGRKLFSLKRRAKYIVAGLDDEQRLVAHLGMTGRLLLRTDTEPADRFVRAVLRLEGRAELRFADQRKFGRVRVHTAAEWRDFERDELGPEPLDPSFSPSSFQEQLARHRGAIKPLLLDQRFLAGLGNIYADESLFLAGIHPARRANSLGPEEARCLHQAIRDVLRQAISHRGTTIASYRDGRGNPGSHQRSLQVYRRQAQPCPRCGLPLERRRLGGRSTHFCPGCQGPGGPEDSLTD